MIHLVSAIMRKAVQYRKCFQRLFVSAAVLYSIFMVSGLTNNADGAWQQDYYLAGDVERGSGRWLWPILDRFTFGVHADPVETLSALALFTFGWILVMDLLRSADDAAVCGRSAALTASYKKEADGSGRTWGELFADTEWERKLTGFLAGAAFLSSASISSALSYRFMSWVYGLSFLFSVLAVCALVRIRKAVPSIIAASVCIVLSMSLYQAYLACFLVAVLTVMIGRLADQEQNLRDQLRFLLRTLISFLAGGLCYSVLSKQVPKLYGGGLSDYNGIGSITAGTILKTLPESIGKAFRSFHDYFFANSFRINVLAGHGLYTLIFAALAAVMVLCGIRLLREKKTAELILLLVYCTALPIAANVFLLLAPESGLGIHMSAGDALIAPALMLASGGILREDVSPAADRTGRTYERQGRKLAALAGILLASLIVYGNAAQVLIDQLAMKQGYAATESMMTNVVSDLKSQGALAASNEYFIIGKPYKNPLFYVSPVYERAGEYARIGDFFLEDHCWKAAMEGVVDKRMGIRLNFSGDTYREIAGSEYLQSMPSYPENGYIVNWDGFVIIKLSEP